MLETDTAHRDAKEAYPRRYVLSKSAFSTFFRISSGNWKVSRRDLINLFEKLGCTVSLELGKGDHSRILLPVNDVVIEHDNEILCALPELLTEVTPTNLTLPNWDEKWDGHVPFYLRKNIMAALVVLGADGGSVFKNSAGGQ